jgi:hypothetical protein
MRRASVKPMMGKVVPSTETFAGDILPQYRIVFVSVSANTVIARRETTISIFFTTGNE